MKGHLSRRTLPAPVEKSKQDPTLSSSSRYTIGKAERFKPLEKTSISASQRRFSVSNF